MLTLEWTPESKRIINNWGTEKAAKLKAVRLEWVNKMEAFMMGSAERSFVIQQQVGGDPWPVNSDGWKIRKVQLGARTTKTNICLGDMMGSLSSQKTSFTAKVGSPMDITVYTQDRKDAALNRPFIPDDEYVMAYGQKLFEDLLRKAV